MTKKRKIILATVAFSILLAIGASLTYIFAVALPQKREKEQLLKAVQEYYDAKLAMQNLGRSQKRRQNALSRR